MKQIDLTAKVQAYPVVRTDQRWLSGTESGTSTEEYFQRLYPQLRDTVAYELWGKGVVPTPGAKGGGLFPVLCRLRNDRLACVMRTSMTHDGAGGELSMTFSSDRGRSWTPYRIIVPGSPVDKRNPAFGESGDGDLILVYGNGSPSEPWRPMEVVRSSDGGETWSAPTQLAYDLGGAHLHPHGQLRLLRNGTLVFNARGIYPPAMYKQHPQLPDRISYLFRSEDNGHTWVKQTLLFPGCSETGFAELNDDRWVAFCRQGEGRPSLIAYSYDRGHTWQDRHDPVAEPDPLLLSKRKPGHPVMLSDGRIIAIYGYRHPPFGIRAVLSPHSNTRFDQQTEYILVDSFLNDDCGYPSTVVFEDGEMVTVAYTFMDLAHRDWNTCCVAYVYHQNLFQV